MNINIKHLEYILEIYRQKSINKAAKSLFISQPNLSRIVRELEQELGFEIMTRDRSGLAFNQQGLYLVDYAEKIIREAKNIENIPSMLSNSSSMHIMSSPSGKIMEVFLDYRNPAVRSSSECTDIFTEGGLQEIMHKVTMREVPLGIMVILTSAAKKYRSAANRYGLSLDLIKDNIPGYIFMSCKHPLSQRSSLTIDEISSEAFVLDSSLDPDDTLPGLLHLQPSSSVIFVSNRASRYDALRSGHYICYASRLSFDRSTHPDICEKPINDFPSTFSLYSLKYADRSYSVREDGFILALKKTLIRSSINAQKSLGT